MVFRFRLVIFDTTYYIIIIITLLRETNKLVYGREEEKLIMLTNFIHDNDDVIGCNKCLCLPKTELNTENSTSSMFLGVQLHLPENK